MNNLKKVILYISAVVVAFLLIYYFYNTYKPDNLVLFDDEQKEDTQQETTLDDNGNNTGKEENQSDEDNVNNNNTDKDGIKDDSTDNGSTDDTNTDDDGRDNDKALAPDFTLNSLSGGEVSLSDYRGKIVFLNFWATWCGYCVEEMPDLEKVNKIFEGNGDAIIVAVNSREKKDTVQDFIDKHGYELPVLLDTDGNVSRTYGVSGIPKTIIIDEEGYALGYIGGMTNEEDLFSVYDQVKEDG